MPPRSPTGAPSAPRWALTVARPLATAGRLLFRLVAVFEALTGEITARTGGDPAIEQPHVVA